MPLLDWEIQDRGARDKHALFYGTSTGYRYRYPAALCVYLRYTWYLHDTHSHHKIEINNNFFKLVIQHNI